jgi:hypothetical protein
VRRIVKGLDLVRRELALKTDLEPVAPGKIVATGIFFVEGSAQGCRYRGCVNSRPRSLANALAWSANGKFRPDLYYRLGVFTIHLPPLREWGDDLPILIHHYVRRFNRELRRKVREVAPEAMEKLRGYSWPGNIRELQSVLKRGLLRSTGTVLGPSFLPALAPRTATGTRLESLIEPRWSHDTVHRRPRRPLRRTVPAMLPLIPRAGLGAARSRTEPGRTRHLEVVPFARGGQGDVHDVLLREVYLFGSARTGRCMRR